MIELITDRSEEDVSRVKYLNNLGIDNWSAEELQEYLTGLKGSYNYTDLNRVESAVRTLLSKYQALGFYESLSTVSYWSKTMYMTTSNASRYLDNVKAVSTYIPLPDYTPNLPTSLSGLNYQGANDIERILEITELMIDNTVAQYFYSNDVFSGEVVE